MQDHTMIKLKINVSHVQPLYLIVLYALVVQHALNAQIINSHLLKESLSINLF